MKMMKRLLLVMLALVLCCTMTACQKETAEAETAADVAATTTIDPNEVLATVGEIALTRAAYEGYLYTLSEYYYSYGYDVSDPSLAVLLQQFALNTGVEYLIMDLKVAELSLTATEEEAAAARESAKVSWDATIEDGLAYYGVTAESTEEERAALLVQVLAELESMGYTEEACLNDAVTYVGYDKLYAYTTEGITVSEEEVLAYYNSLVESDKELYGDDAAAYEEAAYMNQLYYMYGMTDTIDQLYYRPAGYRLVTHILLEADEELLAAYADLQATYEEQQLTLEEGGEVTEALVTAEEIENARLAILAYVQPTVDEINQKLAEGATFAELIPQYTTDAGMADEASIAAGYEVHKDSVNWVIPFRDQSFTVDNIGDITAPVVTDYGVHIIQYVADLPGGAIELTDAMYASFEHSLLLNAWDNAYYDQIEKWVNEANVVYTEAGQAILDLVAE